MHGYSEEANSKVCKYLVPNPTMVMIHLKNIVSTMQNGMFGLNRAVGFKIIQWVKFKKREILKAGITTHEYRLMGCPCLIWMYTC